MTVETRKSISLLISGTRTIPVFRLTLTQHRPDVSTNRSVELNSFKERTRREGEDVRAITPLGRVCLSIHFW